MSIPPLVCSTPPPPDQCEDEKNSDDFDIGYNLSQEYEEQNAYEFNDFCTFNTYKTSGGSVPLEDIDTSNTLNNEKELTKDVVTLCKNYEEENFNASIFEEKRIDEDNIEDLDLQLENISPVNAKESSKDFNKKVLDGDSGFTDTGINIDQIEAVTSSPSLDNEPSTELSESDCTKDINCSKDTNFEDKKILNAEEPAFTANFESEDEEKICESDTYVTKPELPYVTESELTNVIDPELLNCSKNNEHCSNDKISIKNESIDTKSDILSGPDYAVCSPKTDHHSQAPFNKQSPDFNIEDDDFGDFDDFQFKSSNINDSDISSEKNPWINNDTEDITFKANFDEIQVLSDQQSSIKSNIESKLESDENGTFDDFDDFKSSDNDNIHNIEIKCEADTKSYPLSPFDIHLSHNGTQITEIVDKVLSTVFEEEISTNIAQSERTLHSFLCETWGHLTEVEVRQPYIVNWNNSLNQKTLLKALCIDSRNILFGPKWNHNMPKYAANLGSSPLQPKKSNTTFPSINESTSSNALNADNWSEPINIEGKEFTYAEALLLDLEHLMATLDQMAHNHSALKISELLSNACSNDNGASSNRNQEVVDEYLQPLPTKSEKMYPNTLNLQPIRQINLPDTHIYTPTDSEIPRSKTIHYDIGAPILIPQLVSDTIKTTYDMSGNDVTDDEYSEFQNFQCGTNINSHMVNTQPSEKGRQIDTIVETLPSFDTPLESNNVLQPIKVEPKLPKLNWPDPGEVKEIFEDFTDFRTHSTWDKSKENIVQNSICDKSTESVVQNSLWDKSTESVVQDSIWDKHKQSVVQDSTLKSDVSLFDTNATTNNMTVAPVSFNTNSHIEKNEIVTDFDDEFDTFQSAIPISTSSQAFHTLSTDVKKMEKLIDRCHVQAIIPDQTVNKTKDSQFSGFSLSDLKQLSDSKNSGDHMKLETVNQVISQSGTITAPVSTVEKLTTSTCNPLVTGTKILQPVPASSSVINHSKQTTGQILQPLSLESYTQINWPNPGVSLQDLSVFNPVKTIQTIKAEASGNHSKNTSPTHTQKNQVTDDEMWSDFVSVNPRISPKLKKQTFTEDDEWSDFVSSPSINTHNGLNTISLNVHTNLSMQNSLTHNKHKQGNTHIDIPTLNYITPKSNTSRSYTDRHFQNL